MAVSNAPIRYSKWRPIGVCDDAIDSKRKAQMFSRDDLEKVLAPGIGRDNWEESPELRKLIERYAKDVAKMSSRAQGMKNPRVKSVKLLGMELHLSLTPDLNRESVQGQVQMFEVSFEEAPPFTIPKQAILWTALGSLLLIALGVVGAMLLPEKENSAKVAEKRDVLCGTGRASLVYEQHIQQVQRELEAYARSAPATGGVSFRSACEAGGRSVPEMEAQLLKCVLQLNRTDRVFETSRTAERATFCAAKICDHEDRMLQTYCRQL
jgi:hypothetical protein